MEPHDVWFVLIAVLWTGYFFLEGFDFGVGVLTRLLARDRRRAPGPDQHHRPVWDGNEVWLLSGGRRDLRGLPRAGTPPSSPASICRCWLILVCLIVRGVAFEYRAQAARGELAAQLGAARSSGARCCPAFLWGVAFANIVRGVPIDAHMEYVGGLRGPAQPVRPARRAGHPALFTFHGAVFTALKTVGDIRERARKLAPAARARHRRRSRVAFLLWTQVDSGNGRRLAALVVAVVALVAALVTNRPGREGWAFAFSGVTIAAAVAMLFLALFPNVMPSSLERGLEPDGHQRVVEPVHAEDHDLVRGDRHARRPALPGLDVLGVPQADRHPAHRRAAH